MPATVLLLLCWQGGTPSLRAHGQTEIFCSIKLYVNIIMKGRRWMCPIRSIVPVFA